MSHRTRVLAAGVALALAAAACADDSGDAVARPAVATSDEDLAVAVASFDLAVGDDERFIAGVLTPDRLGIVGGKVSMVFTPPDGTADDVMSTTATFLPVPGLEPGVTLDKPSVVGGADGVGVYETRVDFDRPGYWDLTVTATVDDQQRVGTTTFEVLDQHQVIEVGEPAPRSETLTVESDADPSAIDSRAARDGELPDPTLHDITIAEAIAQGRPTVVVFATPVYCVSRFCGPITDTVEDLAGTYGDRAEFVHVEIWQDFDTSVLNPAVEEWILTAEGNGGEPWVFLIGADGDIAARWDNVLDRQELVDHLEQLPAE